MLKLLAEYAYGHGLEPEPGFKPKTVRWALAFSSEGRFLGLTLLGDQSFKRNPGHTFTKCPDLTPPEMIRGKIKSHFLVDTAETIALYGKNADDLKLKESHKFFISLLEKAGETVPELAELAGQLKDEGVLQEICQDLQSKKASPTDKMTFMMDGEYLLDSDSWHVWWRNFRKELASDAGKKTVARASMRCFISGQIVPPLLSHPIIENLWDVGGQRSGDRLVCFDKEAFRSYGLEQSANAAVSEEAASAYRAGLNQLIKENGQRLAGAKIVHWFAKKVVPDDDPLKWLNEGTEQQELTARELARKLLDGIRNGERADLRGNYFYALTLSGAAGRVMVRDWMEGQFEELVENVFKWFNDLEITNLSGGKLASDPGLERIVTCLLQPKKMSQNYIDWIKPVGAERLNLLQAAIKGLPIPYNVIPRITHLHTNFILQGELVKLLKVGKQETETGLIYSMLYARMGLIKAYNIRKYRKEGNDIMVQSFTPYLNEQHPSPAYQCGRLMAVLAAIQDKAYDEKVKAGIVQRYYAAASTTPALVLGRLIRTSQYHLNKLDGGLAHWYEDKIAGIMGGLKDSIPSTLTLEKQSLFALGYYQQLADLRTKKNNNDNQEEKNE